MNQRYISGAVIPDPEATPEIFERDPVLYHQATTRPGAKIPHVWLVGRNGRRLSTLDMVGKGKFTIVTGLGGGLWAEAAARMNLPFVRTALVGSKDFQDLYCDWQECREIDESGVLLVRPDAIVAWRSLSAARSVDDAETQLRGALAGILNNDGVQEPSATFTAYEANFEPHRFQ